MDNYALQAKNIGGLAAQQTYASANTNPAVQSMSEGILSRLSYIRSNLIESRASLGSAADKIVGTAPTPIATGTISGQIGKDHPPASSFLDSLSRIIGEIESIGAEVQEHLNRLHRAF